MNICGMSEAGYMIENYGKDHGGGFYLKADKEKTNIDVVRNILKTMTINHPFLRTDKLDILYLIVKVHQACSANKTKGTCGKFVSRAGIASFARYVTSSSVPVMTNTKSNSNPPNWVANVSKTGVVRNFLAQGNGGTLKGLQGTADLTTLVRLLQNLVVHYSDPKQNLNLDHVYQDIQRTWPLLIPCMYELMYLANATFYTA